MVGGVTQQTLILWRNQTVDITSKVILISLMVIANGDLHADNSAMEFGARRRHHHHNSDNDDRDTSITCPFKKTATAFTVKRKALKYPYANGTSVLDAYSGRWNYDTFMDIPRQ